MAKIKIKLFSESYSKRLHKLELSVNRLEARVKKLEALLQKILSKSDSLTKAAVYFSKHLLETFTFYTAVGSITGILISVGEDHLLLKEYDQTQTILPLK
ncbi:MAG: hypothetical protein RLZ12_1022, partial [Bacillota bacterium]